MVPHPAAEEKEVTASNLKKLDFSEKEVAKVDKKIEDAIRKVDGSIFVPMMYYTMDDGELLNPFTWALHVFDVLLCLPSRHEVKTMAHSLSMDPPRLSPSLSS